MGPAIINSEIYGVQLPPGFPDGWNWISSNGRYVTADGLFAKMPMHLDTWTGVLSIMPGTPIAKPLTNYPTNDGSAILSGYWQVDEDGKWEFHPGYWFWKPGLDPVSIFSETDAQSLVISPTGRRFAFKRVQELGPQNFLHTLRFSILKRVSKSRLLPSLFPSLPTAPTALHGMKSATNFFI